MALNKPKPAFEDGDLAVVDAPVAVPSVAVAQNPGTAVAPPAKTSLVGGAATKFINIFEPFLNKLEPVAFGTLPKLVASNGLVMDDEKRKHGAWFQLQLLSYNFRWTITPGEEGSEAGKLIRSSYDGKHLEGSGVACQSYLDDLKAQGYDKASIKKYVEVIGFLVDCAVASSDLIGKVVVVQCSPESLKKFDGYMLQRSASVCSGKALAEGSDLPYFAVDVKTLGQNTFSYFKVQDNKPA